MAANIHHGSQMRWRPGAGAGAGICPEATRAHAFVLHAGCFVFLREVAICHSGAPVSCEGTSRSQMGKRLGPLHAYIYIDR